MRFIIIGITFFIVGGSYAASIPAPKNGMFSSASAIDNLVDSCAPDAWDIFLRKYSRTHAVHKRFLQLRIVQAKNHQARLKCSKRWAAAAARRQKELQAAGTISERGLRVAKRKRLHVDDSDDMQRTSKKSRVSDREIAQLVSL